MKTELECLPCFFRQVSRTLAYAGVNGEQGWEITRKAERIIEGASFDQAPARISTMLHRLIRQSTRVDPYQNVKAAYNRIALDQLPGLRRMMGPGADGPAGLAAAVRAAIAGNIIDFGIYDRIDLAGSLAEAFQLPLPQPAFRQFSDAVAAARNILYLCDNAGEVVFDRVLIESLRQGGRKVTAVVKGVPVINDATMEDARAAGLTESADCVIDNGNDGIGTLLELCSAAFREAYRDADLIISKGQANFETLAPERDGRTFFLFKVKCPVVAGALGKQEGDIVLQGPCR